MWATPEDIKKRWLFDEDLPADAVLLELIEDAEDTIQSRFPDIGTRIFEGELPQRRVVKIISELVMDRVINPRGTRQMTTGTGPFSDSETFGGNNPGRMVLSEAQIKELSPVKSKRAFTVNTIPTQWGFGR